VLNNVTQTTIVRVRGFFLGSLRGSLGVGFCVATAALLSAYLKDGENVRFVAPVICLQVVILASVIFAVFLFPPNGLAIQDVTERIMLLILIGGTLIVSAFVPRNFPPV
jgi:hypothetical protein